MLYFKALQALVLYFYGLAGLVGCVVYLVSLPTDRRLRAPSVTTREHPHRSLLLSPADGCWKTVNPSITWPLLVTYIPVYIRCVLLQEQPLLSSTFTAFIVHTSSY